MITPGVSCTALHHQLQLKACCACSTPLSKEEEARKLAPAIAAQNARGIQRADGGRAEALEDQHATTRARGGVVSGAGNDKGGEPRVAKGLGIRVLANSVGGAGAKPP